jgi:predicted P-loop ATPase
MVPGCKYDEMLVLESGQGMNKSSALRALCPNPEWFSDDLPLNVDSRQIIERTLGKWIIEAGDLTGHRKADRDHLKSMLSRGTDGPARMAYAHFPVERARQFIIIGTTNDASYLADMTGARRFWPVLIKEFDVEKITDQRDQLWAEAKHFEGLGESIRLSRELWEDAAGEQEKRRDADAWEDAISEHLTLLRPKGSGRLQVTTEKIWDCLNLSMAQRDRPSSLRIAGIMQRFGFERHKIKDGGILKAGYKKDQPGFLPIDGDSGEDMGNGEDSGK